MNGDSAKKLKSVSKTKNQTNNGLSPAHDEPEVFFVVDGRGGDLMSINIFTLSRLK